MKLVGHLAGSGLAIAEEIARRRSCKYYTYFPDDGPLRRELYRKHMMFIAAGRRHKERLFLAANQIGKTETVAFEVTAHTTGRYHRWWPGKQFDGPQRWWCAGDTMLTTRDIQQVALFGEIDGIDKGEFTGMVPPNLVLDFTRRSGGVAKCLDVVWIRWGQDTHHGAPLTSTIEFKSYDQKRKAFQGKAINGGIWLDEEPPDPTETKVKAEVTGAGDIYTECLLRTATTDGIILASFTPLRGLTPFVKNYLETSTMVDDGGRIVDAKSGFWPGASEAMTA